MVRKVGGILKASLGRFLDCTHHSHWSWLTMVVK